MSAQSRRVPIDDVLDDMASQIGELSKALAIARSESRTLTRERDDLQAQVQGYEDAMNPNLQGSQAQDEVTNP